MYDHGTPAPNWTSTMPGHEPDICIPKPINKPPVIKIWIDFDFNASLPDWNTLEYFCLNIKLTNRIQTIEVANAAKNILSIINRFKIICCRIANGSYTCAFSIANPNIKPIKVETKYLKSHFKQWNSSLFDSGFVTFFVSFASSLLLLSLVFSSTVSFFGSIFIIFYYL